MLVCVDCKKEMTVVKNGYGVRYGQSHVYPGDLFKCKSCNVEVIRTNKEPIHDPEKEVPSLQMKDDH